MLIQCASEGAPGGGPPDKTPPALINSTIPTGSTNIPENQEIVFFFSENINPDNINKNVTLFPLSDEPANIRVKGKSLIIKPADQWDPNVVYTLILDKGISDYQGNGLDKPIQISFTSGPKIPQNRILGRVSGLRKGSTALIALSRQNENPDSVILKPEYYTQTGPEGNFSFNYLPSELFHIAGYIDLDNSNSFKAKFDGVCIPLKNALIPDTLGTVLLMQAVYDNFLPGFAIKAESIDPMNTQLTFSKAPANYNGIQNISSDSVTIDSLIIKDDECNIFHSEVSSDTLTLSISGFKDKLGISIADSSFKIPVTTWPDSFFHLKPMGSALRITPDPGQSALTAIMQTENDTSEIELIKEVNGFFRLQQIKTQRRGTCLISLSSPNTAATKDSLYSLKLDIPALPEYGAVLGHIESDDISSLRLVLDKENVSYDISIDEKDFMFDEVLPGSYVLSYYVDTNLNGRRDLGNLYPFMPPEFLHTLDTEVQVRARWDTELESAYKIVVENDK